MSRTETLTADQWIEVEQAKTEWLAHGLSTTTADRPTAETAITEMYRLLGKTQPQFVWVDSPAAAHLALGLLFGSVKAQLWDQLWDQLGNQLGNQLWDQLWDQLRAQLGNQLWDQLWDQLRAQLGNQLRAQLRAQLWDQLWAQLWAQLGTQLRAQLRDQPRDSVNRNLWRAFWGNQESYWIALYEVTRRLGIVTYPEEASRRLDLWADIARSTGWWWPYEGICVMSDRPAAIHWDTQGRLHCETGPAVSYRDGWTVHSWHGTRVPADLVEGAGWTVEQIMQERNAEIRRCAIERFGWDRFVDHGLQLIASCPDPGNPGHDIALYDLPRNLADMYQEPARIFLCTNGTVERDGTRRRFGLVVPAHHTDPVEAAADMYGWPVEAYRRLEVRR